jgi:7-cyano-7-deazaguanine reductase
MPSLPSKTLETFANPAPHRDFAIHMEVPEFTCLCPLTGQPDFATIVVDYIPTRCCVELKSLKLYMWSYRNEGAFHEAVTNRILDDLVARPSRASCASPRSGTCAAASSPTSSPSTGSRDGRRRRASTCRVRAFVARCADGRLHPAAELRVRLAPFRPRRRRLPSVLPSAVCDRALPARLEDRVARQIRGAVSSAARRSLTPLRQQPIGQHPRPSPHRLRRRHRHHHRLRRRPPHRPHAAEGNRHRRPPLRHRRASLLDRVEAGLRREELDRYGDSTLGDVLKRLPGVVYSGVPGRGGDIRMRGLGRGYTMILLNGEPAPRGFAIDSLSPDQVERIEIYRAPVAEHSARAIAGTINIILKEDLTKRENEARVTLAHERTGLFIPNVSLQRTDKLDNFSYNFTVNSGYRNKAGIRFAARDHRDRHADRNTVLHQRQHSHGANSYAYLGGNGQLTGRLDGGNGFTLTPFLNGSKGDSHTETELEQDAGTRPGAYARSYSETPLDKRARTGDRQLAAALQRTGRGSDSDFNVGTFPEQHRVQHDPALRKRRAGASDRERHRDPRQQLQPERQVLEAARRRAPVRQRLGDRGRAAASRARTTCSTASTRSAQFGDIEAKTGRFALYAQDEVDINPLWSAYGGLRWESNPHVELERNHRGAQSERGAEPALPLGVEIRSGRARTRSGSRSAGRTRRRRSAS